MSLRQHGRYDYSPIIERPVYDWPNGTRLAVYLALNLEHFAFGEGLGAQLAPGGEEPDVLNYAWRDYGNRVGVWRLLRLFDDQPTWFRTDTTPILSIPYPQEINDIPAIVVRRVEAAVFADMIVDNFDEMLEQSTEQPLVCGIALHPYIVGQPFRLRQLRRALTHIVAHGQKVWFTHPGAIAEYVINTQTTKS